MSSPRAPAAAVIHSALASPRSSTSSSEPSNPPLTPMLDVEKQVGRLVVTAEAEEEAGVGAGEAEVVGEAEEAEGERKAKEKHTSTPSSPSPYHISPPRPAQGPRTRSSDEASSQFASFSFAVPGQPHPHSPSQASRSRTSSISRPYRYQPGPSSPPLPSPTRATPASPTMRGTGLTAPPLAGGRRPYPSPTGPQEGFSFGTCPSAPLMNTPTAEMGAFEYPEHMPGSPVVAGRGRDRDRDSVGSVGSSHSHRSSVGSVSSLRRHDGSVPLALGESHRRNSIISRPSLVHTGTGSSVGSSTTLGAGAGTEGFPSPPQTRRSSTTSTIATIPAAGRRPSILHSSTIEGSGIPSVAGLALSGHTPLSAHPGASTSARRGSLMFPFPAKPLPSPVPPSLLARRGSLPARQLLNMPSPLHPPPGPLSAYDSASARAGGGGDRTRASFSAATYGTPGQLTTHQLYNRRDSILSEGSSIGSGGSGGTVVAAGAGGTGTRRSSLRGTPSAVVTARTSVDAHYSANRGPGAEADDEDRGNNSRIRRASMPASSLFARQVAAGENLHVAAAGPGVPRGEARHDASLSTPAVTRAADPSVASASASPRYRTRQSGQWSARPSLSGRSLSSSEESNEEAENGDADGYDEPTITRASKTALSNADPDTALEHRDEAEQDAGDVTDEVESLPTPGTAELGSSSGGILGNAMGFKDPWASPEASAPGEAGAGAGARTGDVGRRGRRVSASGGMARPPMETIESYRPEL